MDEIENLFNLKDKLVLITGGQGDLGSEYVRTLVLAGAKVAIFDISKKVNPKVEALINQGYSIKNFCLDITNKKSVQTAFLKLIESFKDTPTILINNAGLSSHPSGSADENGIFEKYPEEVWDAMLDSHLKGAFIVSQVFIEKYRAANKKEGSIINISSIYGVVSPEQSLYDFRRQRGEKYYKPIGYSVAKSGMLNFTRWLAEYSAYEQLGLRVNTLVLGGVYALQDPLFVKEYKKRTMLDRMATNKDFNGAILFLASKASEYMTGSIITIDGGWTAR